MPAKTTTLQAVDPQTGAVFTRRTARTYVAAVVFTGSQGQPICDSWCGRPDLAAKALAKAQKAWPSARLAPVVDSAHPAPAPARRIQLVQRSNGWDAPTLQSPAERVADEMLGALADLSAQWEAEPQGYPERMGFATLNPATECWAEPLPADCYPPAPAGPQLPAFVTYSQPQQQPQQAPAAACSYDPRRAEFSPATCFAKVGPVVAPGPQARKTAPARLPADISGLLSRFGLTLEGLLTEGLSNAKLAKGAALAWPVILHHLPAKALAQAVAGAKPGPTAPRSRIDGLQALAEREGILSLALAHNGCPWASKGCAAGCLAWAGHGGMSATVAAARARRTLAYLADPAAYGRAIVWAIARAWGRAQAKGLPLAVRLRGTDDLAWHLQRVTISPAEAQALARRYGLPVAPGSGQTLPEVFSLAPAGSLQWYEYSKAPTWGAHGLRWQRSAGWDVTASLAADRPDGLSHALQAVAYGFRLAVPVALPKGQPLPEALLLRTHPEAGVWRLKCIDGDVTDHRWADPAGPQPGGFDGVAVILRTKTSRGRGPEADAFSLAPTFGAWQPLAGGGEAALSTLQWEA